MSRFAVPDFTRALQDGERFGEDTVRLLEVGPLVLPTGRIVACDPSSLTLSAEPAYTRIVPPGRYPVLLSLLTRGDPSRLFETVACAALCFADAPIDRWEMALRAGEDESTLLPGGYFGYGVDGGKGCFVDELAVERLAPEQERYWAFLQELQRAGDWNPEPMFAAQPAPFNKLLNPFVSRSWADRHQSAVIEADTGANIVIFKSGIGDGCYASYFGLTADGTPAYLVTDFGLLVEAVTEEVKLPIPVQEYSELRHPELSHAGIDCIQVWWEPATGRVTIRTGEAPYLERLRFENRPGQGLACTLQGDTHWYDLSEPLQPTAKVTVKYTLRTEAL